MSKKSENANIESETPRILPPPPQDQLVDRRQQLDKFAEILDRIGRQGSIASNLFEWYGSPGIGKSMLVSMLAHQADERHAYWAIVDFKKSAKRVKLYTHDPIILLEEIVSGLINQIAVDTHDLNEKINEYRNTSVPKEGVILGYSRMDQETRLYNRPPWLDGLRNVVIAFIKLVNTLPEHSSPNSVRPVALFFDETEYADIDLVDWIEEWIINPLLQIKHCVVVWTARRPWRWKRPEVRRRLASEELEVFEPEMVKEQIQSGSFQPDLATELFKNVHTLTGGHPYANYIVINKIDSLARGGEIVTSATFPEFESELLIEVFHTFIDGYAFRDLDSGDLKVACKFIALVRLFDSTMLREILRTCVGAPFDTWNQEDFGHLLLQLKKTQLLVWDKGYALDAGLRHIIEKYFMVSEQNMFVKANQAALRVYEDWLERPVDNRGLFVVEELFHNAALEQIGGKKDLLKILEKRLVAYPNWIKDEQALDNALERLEGEIGNDKELDQYASTGELVKLVQKFRKARSLSIHSKK